MFARELILGSCIVLAAHGVAAQQLQAGVGVTIGLAGLGVDGDLSLPRTGVFLRGQASAGDRATLAGMRGYFYGKRGEGFYAAPFIGRIYCGSYHFGGSGKTCDEKWHTVWGGFVGVESGGPTSAWSLWFEGGPIRRSRDVPGIRPWTAGFGVRIRGPRTATEPRVK